MHTLFPEIQPYATHAFAVEAPHVLHVEECGNPEGIPVLFLHGGPGAGFQAWNRRFFDPERYRIVLFDQRGAGKSTPHAHLEGNTTQALVSDIEALRAFSALISGWCLAAPGAPRWVLPMPRRILHVCWG